MRLEIKTKEGLYITELDSFGLSGSVCYVYKVLDRNFLCIKYKSEKMIAKSVSSVSYQDAVFRGPSILEREAMSVIKKYELAKKEWNQVGIEL